jgi:hypothetical protein
MSNYRRPHVEKIIVLSLQLFVPLDKNEGKGISGNGGFGSI